MNFLTIPVSCWQHNFLQYLRAIFEKYSAASFSKNDEKRKAQRSLNLWAFLITTRQRPTFPHPHECSIIGPGGLNFRVRNGNGWDPSGMVTENSFSGRIQKFILRLNTIPLLFTPYSSLFFRPCLSRTNVVKSHGRLVLVSFRPYSPSTPSLSNS